MFKLGKDLLGNSKSITEKDLVSSLGICVKNKIKDL